MIKVIATRLISEKNRSEAFSRGIEIKDMELMSFTYSVSSQNSDALFLPEIPLVLTSQHAVKSVCKFLSPEFIVGRKCFCVGSKTADSAVKKGFDLISFAENAAELSDLILKSKCKKILYCCANVKLSVLHDKLQNTDCEYMECETYQKHSEPITVDEPYKGIAFFSPSQIEIFMQCNSLKAEVPAFCIGLTTANYLRERGHDNIFVSDHATEESVLNKIYTYFNE